MDARNNLLAWEAFTSLVRTGSITQTAISLDRSGSDISKMIRALEADLGYELFDRSRRPFPPTQKAMELAASIAPLITNLHTVIQNSGEMQKTTLLRLSAPIDLATEFIPEQMMIYGDERPGIRFDLTLKTDVTAVLDGTIDVALMERPKNATNLLIRPCITCTCCPLASPQYLEKHGTPQTIEDLRSHTGLIERWNNRPATSFLYSPDGSPSELLHWKKIFVTDNQITLRTLALHHRGITVDLASSSVIEELDKGLLVPVLTDWRRENWELCIVTRQDKENASPEIRHFAEWWAAREAHDSMSRIITGDTIVQRIIAQRASQRNP